MQPPKSDICVICGLNPATTTEHLPPRGFFKGMAGNFRTVPACSECNNGSSSDDEALRNYISAQVGKETSASASLWDKGAHKSLKRSGKLRADFLSTMQEVKLVEGNSTVTRLAFLIPVSLYQRVFERVTRGLYFWHSGTILPTTVPVKIDRLETPPDLSQPDLQVLENQKVLPNAFEYWYSLAPEDNNHGVWLFCIHNNEWVYATTGALVDEPF